MTADSPLTDEEQARAFQMATNGMEGSRERWAERVAKGLTDEQLEHALKYEIGIFGGRSDDGVGVTYQANGLKIWADHCIGSRSAKPILEGRQTVAFARRVYGISDPEDKQMGLFS